ncbi:hypothetical protein IWW37_001355 [Coemansia sp. RSA 2050]|nr:hypothetical protein IWW37_001355 [Coemansia sp. RSA 2050]KAJ2735840.1 hypothetical protein IW152_001312 [Coemansia sp. BCRC 34962]
MQLFKFSAIVAAIMSAAAIAQAADWNQRATQECARRSWTAIKSSVDPRIQLSWNFMPPPIRMALQQANAVNSDNSLIANPSLEQIALIANTLPQGVFLPFADDIVEQCLSNPPTLPTVITSTSTTSTTSTPSTPTSATSTPSTPTSTTNTPTSPTSTPTSPTNTQPTLPTSQVTSTPSSTSTDVPTPTTETTPTSTPVVPTSTPIKCIPRPH